MTLKQSFKYRNIWMGIAMLWVIWYHLPMEISNTFIRSIKNMGYGGVDIFLFASGIGCYFSLDKDNNCLMFLKRRVQRLIPTYWTFLFFWIAYRKIFEYISFRSILGNIFCVSSFGENNLSFNWYISAIWLLYLLAPIIKEIIEVIHSKIKLAALVMLLLLVSVSFWEGENMILISRIPIFLIGMYFAKISKNKTMPLKKMQYTMLVLGTALGFVILRLLIRNCFDEMWSRGYWWYPFILIVPGLCMGISFVAQKTENMKVLDVVRRGIEWVGKYSFELFLLHIWFFEIYQLLINRNLIVNRTKCWIILVILLIPGCLILTGLKNIFMLGVRKVSDDKKHRNY